MTKSNKCRSLRGPENCVDPKCPEKIAYIQITEALSKNTSSLSYNEFEDLKQRKAKMEQTNPTLVNFAPLPNFIKEDENGKPYTLAPLYDSSKELEFYYGDLTDRHHLVALHEADPKKNYQLADCGVLAGHLWHLNDNVEDIYILKTKDEPIFGIHMFVKLKDGTYVDSLGVWSEKTMLSEWQKHYPEGTIERFDDPDEEPIEKNPNERVYNRKLYDAVEAAINSHLNKTAPASLQETIPEVSENSSEESSWKQKIQNLFSRTKV